MKSVDSGASFDNSQRTKKQTISWGTWFLRQFCFVTIKFAFCFAFYNLHYHSSQIESPPANPALQEHLSEFRKESRTSRHELVMQSMLRSRKLAENSEVDGVLGGHQAYTWEPLETQCSGSDLLDPFPESFDSVFYRAQHEEDYDHYIMYGRENGWNCTRGQYMRDIIGTEIVPVLPGNTLEIGPFINPLIRNTESSKKVRYFDVVDWEGSKKKAEESGYIPSPDPVKIDYIDALGDLSSIGLAGGQDAKFSMVVSSNVIGVQLDLVRHLQQVGNLLVEGGYYTVLVPDKRFSHDHFSTETTIADVLQDYFAVADGGSRSRNTKHRLRSLIENQALQVANDADKNWHGEYGFPYEGASDKTFLGKLKQAIAEFQANKDSTEYVDVLRYQFTPHSLALVMDTLYALGLTDLRVHRLYDTLANSDEFSMVLKRCTPV